MRALSTADYVVIGLYLAISLGAGIVWARRAGRSMSDFFLSGRSLPFWLAGVSMAATNFSIDTPLAITRYVARQGIAGVWFFWASAVSALLAAFLFARLWSRAGVLTDAELIELRYAGRSAAWLRLFKGFYFGVVINCYVLGWVLKAVVKVMSGVTDLPVSWILGVSVTLAFAYTVTSGLKGVVWTDFFQWGIGLLGSAILAVYAMRAVGGVEGLLAGLEERLGSAREVTSFVPTVDASGDGPWMPLSAFLVYVLVQWWAHKYADGGGKHIQRMLACKSEGHAQGATVLFAFLNYALQVWPWILTALAAIVILGPLEDPEMGYPLLMARLLPSGLLGLLLVTMVGAFMSTVDTHLNLGSAYLVNDIYKRFLKRDASERHYVVVSRLAMVGTLAAAIAVALSIESIGEAWKFILSFASGAGLTWIVRWFWWRPNAWTEVSAMVASGLAATYLQLFHGDMPYTSRLLVVVGLSTVVWLVVTYATPPVCEERLVAFVERLRPGSPGWRRLCEKHRIETEPVLLTGLGDWALGVACLFSANFGLGALLLGRGGLAACLAVLCVLSGALLLRRLRGRSPAERA